MSKRQDTLMSKRQDTLKHLLGSTLATSANVSEAIEALSQMNNITASVLRTLTDSPLAQSSNDSRFSPGA